MDDEPKIGYEEFKTIVAGFRDENFNESTKAVLENLGIEEEGWLRAVDNIGAACTDAYLSKDRELYGEFCTAAMMGFLLCAHYIARRDAVREVTNQT